MSEPVIATEALTKRYGRTVALLGLDLEVEAGEVFGYLGPNGAGKTTTIRLLTGLARPSAGRATVMGHDAWRDKVAAHGQMAYVPADVAVWPRLTGLEILEFLTRLHGSIDTGYREELVERFEFDPAKKGREYSTGNRQKLAIIAALSTRAPVLVLDEPSAGLDPLMERAFRECLREASGRGQTVFLSSHQLSEVEAVCTRVGILRAGRLVEVATLEQLRRLSATHAEITFGGPAPDLTRVDGVEVLSRAGDVVYCSVHGSINGLLDALAGSKVSRLVSREPSLEEIFLAYYGNE